MMIAEVRGHDQRRNYAVLMALKEVKFVTWSDRGCGSSSMSPEQNNKHDKYNWIPRLITMEIVTEMPIL
jgi:hypothetical protein